MNKSFTTVVTVLKYVLKRKTNKFDEAALLKQFLVSYDRPEKLQLDLMDFKMENYEYLASK